MKTINKFFMDGHFIVRAVIILATLSILTCEKDETVQEQPMTSEELPPIAIAGPDQEIDYPTVNVQLDGSTSNDSNGVINSWFWENIDGPYYCFIQTPTNAKTKVEGLINGTYKFELTVTNNAGLTASDIVKITVRGGPDYCGDENNRTLVSTTLVPVGKFPETDGVALTAVENKIFFAGGRLSSGGISPEVNIFDITSQTWTTARLSFPRGHMVAVANRSKVFFAGGINAYDDVLGLATTFSDDVEIYDVKTDVWTHNHLSIAGTLMAATTVGDKVLFAGGINNGYSDRPSRVDIYDQSVDEWTTASLSENRPSGTVAVTVDDKAYFAGSDTYDSGPSDKVDVYDDSTGTWSIENLYEKKSNLAGIAINNKIYWAGGWSPDPANPTYNYPSRVVEILDTKSRVSTLACLKQPTVNCKAVQLGSRIVFVSPNFQSTTTDLDIYNTATDSWYYVSLPYFIQNAISVNDTIYVTVTENENTTVYKLDLY